MGGLYVIPHISKDEPSTWQGLVATHFASENELENAPEYRNEAEASPMEGFGRPSANDLRPDSLGDR